MKHTILFWIALTLATTTFAQQEAKKVLFIGNSYTEVNSLPTMVQHVTESAGRTINVQSNSPGGCTFAMHCTNQSMTLIQQGGWDVVVLQEQSQLPSFPQSQVESEVFPYAARLVDSIYAHSLCVEPLFYMTWGRRNGDQQNASSFPILGTYEGMDSMIYERYMFMKEQNDAAVSPVGRVWRALRTHYPDINLYDSDGSHPSVAGTYAAACSFYATIFEDSPLHIQYTANLDEPTAEIIRRVVDSVVMNQLAFWKRPLPQAHFDSQDDASSSTITFTNQSTHADQYVWDFGDGTSSTENSPVHSYADTGWFTVTLVASRHCMFDTTVLRVYHGGTMPAGINEVSAAMVLALSPNPATTQITIRTAQPGVVRVYDLEGRLLDEIRVSGTTHTYSLDKLKGNACYLLRMGNATTLLFKK